MPRHGPRRSNRSGGNDNCHRWTFMDTSFRPYKVPAFRVVVFTLASLTDGMFELCLGLEKGKGRLLFYGMNLTPGPIGTYDKIRRLRPNCNSSQTRRLTGTPEVLDSLGTRTDQIDRTDMHTFALIVTPYYTK